MRLLVVGEGPETGELVEALSAPQTVERCRDVAEARARLDADGGGYDWVLVDGDGACGGPGLGEGLGAGARVSRVSRVPARAPGEAPPVCAVETTPSGLQILRCALRHAMRDPGADPALRAAMADKPLVFEYHRSCERRRAG